MKIFISYSKNDEKEAKELYNFLIKKNYQVWFDTESLLPGQQWKIEIDKSIRNSDIFIMLLSLNSINKRGFFYKEMNIAKDILDEIPEDSIFFLPVRINKCPIPESIANIHYIDLFPNKEFGFMKLTEAIEFQRKRKVQHIENIVPSRTYGYHVIKVLEESVSLACEQKNPQITKCHLVYGLLFYGNNVKNLFFSSGLKDIEKAKLIVREMLKPKIKSCRKPQKTITYLNILGASQLLAEQNNSNEIEDYHLLYNLLQLSDINLEMLFKAIDINLHQLKALTEEYLLEFYDYDETILLSIH